MSETALYILYLVGVVVTLALGVFAEGWPYRHIRRPVSVVCSAIAWPVFWPGLAAAITWFHFAEKRKARFQKRLVIK